MRASRWISSSTDTVMFFVLTVSQSPWSTVYGGSIVLTSTVAVATLIGGTSGFLGGKLDLAVQRFVGVELELPRRGPMREPPRFD